MPPLSFVNPLFYRASVGLHRLFRRCRLALDSRDCSCSIAGIILPFRVFSHRSLLLRELAGTDMTLQLNKVKNLRIAVSLVDGVVVYPGATFSFWKLVGKPSNAGASGPGCNSLLESLFP
jgi:vancomycin resistance protein VanW